MKTTKFALQDKHQLKYLILVGWAMPTTNLSSKTNPLFTPPHYQQSPQNQTPHQSPTQHHKHPSQHNDEMLNTPNP